MFIKKEIFTFLFLFSLLRDCLPQDIVPNSSFEDEKKQMFTSDAETWRVCISDDTPDVFCINDKKTKGIFSTYQGGAFPLSGNCFVGLFLYRVDKNLHYENVREFIYEKLNIPLKKDSLYSVCISVFLDAESNVSVKNFDIYFSKNKIVAKNVRSLFKLKPQVSFNKHYLDTSHWINLHAEYRASGNENYIAIGNFRPDSNTIIKQVKPAPDSRKSKWNIAEGELIAYYYIDNIYITPLKKTNIIENTRDPNIVENLQIFQFSEVKSDTTITIPDIFFEFDSSNIMNQSFGILLQLADALNKSTEFNLEIQGHTDNVGSAEYNFELSERRAKAVYDFLCNNGVMNSRITYKGFGCEVPVADNNTDIGRSLNRRVVFRIFKKYMQ